MDNLKLYPASRMRGRIVLPASKSISNRALVINALSGSTLLPENLSDSDDTEVMLRALASLGPTPEASPIDIGAAGTSMRFLTALLSVTPGEHVITGSERMRHRPISILVDALRQLGAHIDYLGHEGYPPLRITGQTLRGGDLELPLTSCAEENVLAYQIDKYHAEDILVHEFAHSIHLIGLMLAVPDFDGRLKQCYENAKAKGILTNTYRETDKEEYLAEAVQDWFNVNAEMDHADGKHNWCNTREELEVFDPDLYSLLAEYFPKTSLQISRHKKVNEISKY